MKQPCLLVLIAIIWIPSTLLEGDTLRLGFPCSLTVLESTEVAKICGTATVCDDEPEKGGTGECGNIKNAFNVSIVTESRNAHQGSDFVAPASTVTFTPDSPEQCLSIDLINDESYELREDFFVNYTAPERFDEFGPKNTIVMIDDDDEAHVAWEKSAYGTLAYSSLVST